MTQWKRVYRTQDSIKAEIVKDLLEQKGITVVLINKQDSSYVVFGEYEIHVSVEEVMEAIKIINNDIDIK